MKKLLLFTICILLALSMSACQNDDLQQNNASSQENARTLIRALTGSDDASNINCLSIIPNNSSEEIQISNSNDWTFLEKYVYSNTITYSEKNSMVDFKKANLIKYGAFSEQLYLLNDGVIIKKEMCGDSGVKDEERSFEVYKAEDKYMINEQKLLDLLNKYQTNSPQININTCEYFVESGRRMVDRKEVSKKEFTEKYAFVLPEDFETANFYFDIPTEDGLEYYNEVENGYIRCLGKDRKSVLDVCICKTRYVGCGFISVTKAELKKTNINNIDVIVCKNSAGEYRGKFEKNGYYFTFQISGVDQDAILSALEDLTE